MQVVFIPVANRDEEPTLTNGMAAWKSDGSKVKLNIIGDDDDFPEDDATLAVSLLSDSDGGVVADNAWYSFRLPFGRSVLAASMTLMLVILPVVIISTQEALRAVPTSLRQGAQGLGCTPWQTENTNCNSGTDRIVKIDLDTDRLKRRCDYHKREESVHDGRDASQQFQNWLEYITQLLGGVLAEVDGSYQSQWQRNQHGDHGYPHRAADQRPNSEELSLIHI